MREILSALGLGEANPGAWTGKPLSAPGGTAFVSYSPGTGEALGRVTEAGPDAYEQVLKAARGVFPRWSALPAPKRGEIVRQFGDALRAKKDPLGDLVTLEVGKIRGEGRGEVQEMVDICDFAVGLSRQLHGLTMHSERPRHRMYEQWHPLGVVGVITAFNFPVAVWAWNAALAWVCGDVTVWKPSEKAPLTAIACQRIAHEVFARNGFPEGVSSLVVGGAAIGERIAADRRIPLVSATGSVRMGRRVGQVVAERLGRSLLELGGNNAVIVTDDADLDLALRAIAFGALGTAGQRCTTTRRVIVHEKVYDDLKRRLVKAYEQAPIGDPLDGKTLVGPLIDEAAVDNVMKAIEVVKAKGGRILCGGERIKGCYMKPAIAEVSPDFPLLREETFGPLLYLLKYGTLDEAIRIQNDVPQGLSSAIFTRDVIEAETFLASGGSDCGIANVNLGTSGAEIGGAFGGEKDTGGGRESGSDAWKSYMRRQTNTINWSTELPLAQGIRFDL
ncbi:MAG TPA: aldehyde dehydrogenase family protein [Planctomycetota bacterium]|nr:aldehyde dehydrogenase family protein [Planctomycetota bacterium]